MRRDVATTRTPADPGALHLEGATVLAGPGPHVGQPAMVAVDVGGLGHAQHHSQLVRLAGAVVGDRQRHRGEAVGQPDDRPGGVTVHGGVEQRLAGDPQQRVFDVAGQFDGSARRPAATTRRSSGMCTVASCSEHLGQAGPVGVAGMVERVDRRAQLLDRRPGQILGQVEPLDRVRSAAEWASTSLRHTSICMPADSTRLRDAVVQFAGDAVPFGVEHLMSLRRTEFALGGQQFGVARLGLRPAAPGDFGTARSSAARPRSGWPGSASPISSVLSRVRCGASTPRRRR